MLLSSPQMTRVPLLQKLEQHLLTSPPKLHAGFSLAGMNPSLWICADQLTVLIRCVNYTRHHDTSFNIFDDKGKSRSRYVILRGRLLDGRFDADSLEASELQIKYDLPTYNSCWLGPEDIRFVDHRRVLCTVPELDGGGNPCVCTAWLDGNLLHGFRVCPSGNKCEKNWMPLPDGISVVYSVDACVLLRDIETQTLINLGPAPPGLRGSTNGVQVDGLLLFLVHSTDDGTSVHRWMCLQNDFPRFSEPFRFFAYSYIEFACSLCLVGSVLYVSLGVDDRIAMVIGVDKEVALGALK